MKVCVIKGTLRPISGPCNDIELMKQDAINSGLNEDEIEFVEADEFFQQLEQLREQEEQQKANMPTLKERIEVLEQYVLEQIFKEAK
jgi:hypothetical protein